MVSAVPELESVVRCIELGATDYLPKPFSAAVLRARLRSSLAAKRLRDVERENLRRMEAVVAERSRPARRDRPLRAEVDRVRTARRTAGCAVTTGSRPADRADVAERLVTGGLGIGGCCWRCCCWSACWPSGACRTPRPAEARRSESLRLAYELRQTSDDLTRMARSYVATGEPRYLAWFREILAIRAGTAPRPVDYDGIYWDSSPTPGSGRRRRVRPSPSRPWPPGPGSPAGARAAGHRAVPLRRAGPDSRSRRSRWSPAGGAADRDRADRDALRRDLPARQGRDHAADRPGAHPRRHPHGAGDGAGRRPGPGLSAAAITVALLLLGGMAVFAAVTRRAVLRPVASSTRRPHGSPRARPTCTPGWPG